jgi:Ala-tRNA(Pro) deacylase
MTLPAIQPLLRHHGVPFQVLEHDAVYTAPEAAQIRGTPLEMGGKALVMKVHKLGFAVLAVRGCDALENKAFRKHLGVQRYRFASRDELRELTGLTPGCVPPFGRPIFDLPLFVDAALAANTEIVFSGGSHTVSIRMATRDWITAAQPADIWAFTKAAARR